MNKVRLSISITLALALAGCMVGPDFSSPEDGDIERYTAEPLPKKTVTAAGKAQHFIERNDIPAQWWQVFHSPALDQLIREGLENSPTLAIATAKLRQAQENVNQQFGSTFYPTIDGNLAVTREQINFQSFGITAFPNPPPFTLYNAGVSIAYTFDIFGANRRQLEALVAMVDYQRFELIASQLTLAANIVTAAINSASLSAQIKTTEQMIALQEKQVDVTARRYRAGGVAHIDVVSQSSQLAQTKSTLPPLQRQREQVRNQLAIYVGKAPSEITLPDISLDDLHLPTELPVSLPSALLRQRPDIQAAEALLHQACANVGVATANLYPTITLTGNFATESTSVGKLFSAGTGAWNIGPGLMQPLFHGGALRAQRRAAMAALEQALAAYQETVLHGFQNVADTLKALEFDAKTLQAKTIAATKAQERYAITTKLYQSGGVSYIALLDAEQQYYQTLLEQDQVRANRFADSAALFQALGGGWWNG